VARPASDGELDADQSDGHDRRPDELWRRLEEPGHLAVVVDDDEGRLVRRLCDASACLEDSESVDSALELLMAVL
jgi:hypothetical protein